MAKFPVRSLRAQSFGPFGNVNIEFSPGLNVIVGDNATGKSQLLKLLYSSTRSVHDVEELTKKDLSPAIASKLVGVFKPDSLGRLATRGRGHARAEATIHYQGIKNSLSYAFSSHSKRTVEIIEIPGRKLADEPVYLPSHELLSFASSFVSLYETRETPFEETWRDTIGLLQRPALRGPREKRATTLLAPLTELLQGGTVFEANGQFYLKQPGIGNLEAPLLAEGHRKLAMIVRLISSGVLLEGGYLFWDEPEANLNPSSQRAVAQALLHMAAQGSQVFVATHSMFLLREIEMLSQEVETRFIGLSRSMQLVLEDEPETLPPPSQVAVTAESSNRLDELSIIAALDAEASQAERYLAR